MRWKNFSKTKIIWIIIICFLIFVSFKYFGLVLGIGISIPPNVCDLKIGYELRGDMLISSRDLCFEELARTKKDVKICDRFKSDALLQRSCLIGVVVAKNDSVMCESLGDYSFGPCLFAMAEETHNPDLCMQIKYGPYRDLCLNLSNLSIE